MVTTALDILPEETLPSAEEAILQFSSQVLAEKSLQAPQRIQITNLLVSGAADIRNAITRLQQALSQYGQFKQIKVESA